MLYCLGVSPASLRCDPRWGGNQMGTRGPGERSTICGEGCAMTSVSMALAGLGVDLAERAVRPDSLNSWLEDNHGYVCIADDCNNLVLSAPNRVPHSRLQFVSEHDKPELDDMRAAVEKGDTIFVGESLLEFQGAQQTLSPLAQCRSGLEMRLHSIHPKLSRSSPSTPTRPNSPWPLSQLMSTTAATSCW